MFSVKLDGQVNERLGLILGRMRFCIRLKNGLVRLAGPRQHHVVVGRGATQQPGDHTVFTLVDG